MKIAVAGTGYVGLVTGVCLAEMGNEVTCLDTQEAKITMLKSGKSPIYEPGLESLLANNLVKGRLHFTTNPQSAYTNAEIIFIAVGTPEQNDGAANLEHIYAVANSIAQSIKNDVIVCTKSTVPVGTSEQIKQIIDRNKPSYLKVEVVSTPEFLREGSAILDFFHGDRIVIGADNERAANIAEQIFLPLKIPIMKTDTRSAEMIKYASNAFLATKISFINEIASICDKVGANIDEVAYGIGTDHRIGPYFLQAGIGYGGSCFPKDTKALIQLAGNVEHQFDLLKAVINVNNHQQSLLVKKAKESVGSLKGKKVALLGLAFKPDTDDVREAASLTLVKDLLVEGATVIGYDPVAIQNAKRIIGNSIEYTTDILSALFDADLALIATEWDQIKHISLDMFCLYMKKPFLVDGRNCYSLNEIQKYPITYFSIGRPPIIKETQKSH
ncbi:UDP-glucose dehydrogenase family protein [Bacillus sp. 1NLA3E]|uniref:UDP-glucose dehydrogenase family protein n=1 Tax=Bacillus sp. 1NLA3E TaxID=666686 RepID=UPI000247F1E1|nr:UDP-glucose/GDP-mannose dehydrogenase family protein [Bacillus sp. 1NLA3E]AGK55342.1 UDP-glucose 6-dehydrogenase ywqF [Bacillus sp. 1NLA3E]